jgi:hypothetical protein
MANDLVTNKFLLDTPKILLHVNHYLGKKKIESQSDLSPIISLAKKNV